MDKWDQLVASADANRPHSDIDEDEAKLLKKVATCTETIRHYSIAYSPHIIVTYHTYEKNNERVIEETVRCRRPCFTPFVLLPDQRALNFMRREQGITEQDSQFSEECKEYGPSWSTYKLGLLITYNIVPFWRSRWRYPLTAK